MYCPAVYTAPEHWSRIRFMEWFSYLFTFSKQKNCLFKILTYQGTSSTSPNPQGSRQWVNSNTDCVTTHYQGAMLKGLSPAVLLHVSGSKSTLQVLNMHTLLGSSLCLFQWTSPEYLWQSLCFYCSFIVSRKQCVKELHMTQEDHVGCCTEAMCQPQDLIV